MPRLAIIGDVHDHGPRLARVLRVLGGQPTDLVVLTGDVGSDPPWHEPTRRRERAAHDASVRGVIDRVTRALDAPVVWVPGNHDLPDPPDHPGGVNADGRVVEVAGLAIAGLGGAGPERFGFPYEWDEAGAARGLARFEGATVDLLLSHTPPRRCALDRTVHGLHVGSAEVRRALGRLRPRLLVCGHIHEAFGVETIEGVPCLNAGSLGEPYGRVLGWRLDWEAGEPSGLASWTEGPGREPVRRDWPLPGGGDGG